MQGVEFSVNVTDHLKDKSLDLGTSIVSSIFVVCYENWTHFVCSIGMASTNTTKITTTALRLLPSVQLYQMRASCTESIHQAKR